MNKCLGGSPALKGAPAMTPEECCSLCANASGCVAWAWGKTFNRDGSHSCNMKSSVEPPNAGNCTSGCKAAGCLPTQTSIVDLWLRTADGEEGPAHGFNNTCVGSKTDAETPGGHPNGCTVGPKTTDWFGGYEDSIFEQHVLSTVEAHDPEDPLFLFWAPHIVHAPLQAPSEFYNKFDMIAATDREGHSRQIYHAMVNL